MKSYVKLFGSILDSTIWKAPTPTKVVWVTMLAMADADGEIMASVPGLADRSRVTMEECLDALDYFMSPDEWSRTKEYEGRRIEEIDGGWRLLNHGKYRKMLSADDQKEKHAKRQARYRERHSPSLTVTSDASDDIQIQIQKQDTTPTPSGSESYSHGFLTFWEAYPRKVAKDAAWRAWKRRNPDPPTLLTALTYFENSPEWKKDNGKFIPYPATWLNAGRWKDGIVKS